MFTRRTQLTDPEFGLINIRRFRGARSVKLRIDHTGDIRISMPPRIPLIFAQELLNQSRDHIRRNLGQLQQHQAQLAHGDIIGKTHRLVIVPGEQFTRIVGTDLHVGLPHNIEPLSAEGQKIIKEAALKALRTQAKAYLARRLQTLADQHGFRFAKIRFGTAGTRWGSCSSSGTISLNIWLMQLPFELIDYVLVHELCHTEQMNHSPKFWALVGSITPNYKQFRRDLKAQHPFSA